jgi:hypothetical protein
VLMVPPEIVPLILKNDWDLVIVKSGWDCCRVRRAEYKVKSLLVSMIGVIPRTRTYDGTESKPQLGTIQAPVVDAR